MDQYNKLDKRFAYIYACGGNPIRTMEQVPENKRHLLVDIRIKDENWQETIDQR